MAIEYDFLLLETGDYLLLEDGGRIIIDERQVADTTSGGGGRPWPQRTLNILLPKRVIMDDEDFLLIMED